MKNEIYRILLVEPDPEVGEYLKQNLELEFNCLVDWVKTAQQALNKLSMAAYDLISTEQYRPSEDNITRGNDLVIELKSRPNFNRHIPILFFTIYTAEIFANPNLNQNNIFILDKTSRTEKYLTWVKILLFSQSKRKEREQESEKIYIPSSELSDRIVCFPR